MTDWSGLPFGQHAKNIGEKLLAARRGLGVLRRN